MKVRASRIALQRSSQVALAVLLIGCNIENPTSPGVQSVRGLDILTEVDGVPLPSPPAAPGSADPCPLAITDGEFSLDQGPRTPQLFTLSVVASRACDPGGIPIDGTEVAHDAGSWSIAGSQISLTSSPYVGHGSHQGTVESLSPEPIVSVAYGDHAYTFRRLKARQELPGYVGVTVTDEQGVAVDYALIVFHYSDGRVERARSRADGAPQLGGTAPGPVVINVAPPAGYAFAPGQLNPIDTTIVSEQTTQVSVVLAKTTAP